MRPFFLSDEFTLTLAYIELKYKITVRKLSLYVHRIAGIRQRLALITSLYVHRTAGIWRRPTYITSLYVHRTAGIWRRPAYITTLYAHRPADIWRRPAYITSLNVHTEQLVYDRGLHRSRVLGLLIVLDCGRVG